MASDQPQPERCAGCSKPITGPGVVRKVETRTTIPGRGVEVLSRPARFCTDECADKMKERKKP